MASRSIPHILLAGMILSAIPALTLARQSFAAPALAQLTLPATLTQAAGLIEAKTDINTLNLSQLAGSNDMSEGDVVYVHLNVDISQPEKSDYRLSYAYAISQNRPQLSDKRTISLRGVVTDRAEDIISIKYLFESFPPNSSINRVLNNSNLQKVDITIDVNHRAVGHLRSVTIDSLTYSLRP